jgi:hypothetical protein
MHVVICMCRKLRQVSEYRLRMIRVARWHIFKPKIPIWVNFGMEKLDIFYGHLEHIRHGHLHSIFYSHLENLLQFCMFSPILVYCVKKNLATLLDDCSVATCRVSPTRRK